MILIKEYGYAGLSIDDNIMWAFIEINGYETYIYGDDDLLESLLEAGFRYEPK